VELRTRGSAPGCADGLEQQIPVGAYQYAPVTQHAVRRDLAPGVREDDACGQVHLRCVPPDDGRRGELDVRPLQVRPNPRSELDREVGRIREHPVELLALCLGKRGVLLLWPWLGGSGES